MLKVSPLAPKSFPHMPEISGVELYTYACGMKYKNRDDMLVAKLTPNTVFAGCFTKSSTASSNVIWAREKLPSHKAQILVVNAGNANAFNGDHGMETINIIANTCAKLWKCSKDEVIPCATGVIGQPMPNQLLVDSLNRINSSQKKATWEQAANAIRTTDTFAKGAYVKTKIGQTEVNICGIAKGSGMIAPNMATMLSYIFTDAKIDGKLLQQIINEFVDLSFNSITVDSDTSTSDTLLMFATGSANNPEVHNINDPNLQKFKADLLKLMIDLAHLVVKDGEGASKFITVRISGAENNNAARIIALSIANSPLVKTAITGCDANWGRLMMAVGKSGQKIHIPKIQVEIGGINIVKDGQLNPSYEEKFVTKHMQGENIDIFVNVGLNENGIATVWTCNLTHEYIDINADYRS